MANNHLCAIVVTFHPDPDVLDNLSTLRPQVEHLVVVDNGSAEDQLAPLRLAAAAQGFELIENGENLGIAAALNLGVRRAIALEAQWVLLFDQDSCVTPGFVEAMLSGFASSSWGDRLAILVPRYVDRRLGSELPPLPVIEGCLELATTSGSLLPVSLFARFGWFREDLFIDGVDYEYSLRVRARGYGIEECRGATLLHSPGSPTHHRFPWGKPFQAANYSPVRRYYQERNKVLVAKVYASRFPGFFVRQFVMSAKDLLKVVLVEENKGSKLRAFLRGLFDGLRGRAGKIA